MAKDAEGKWQSVKDPDAMAAALNGPGELIRLEARQPDHQSIRQIMDRMFGMPSQEIAVTVTPAAKMSDEELHAKLQTLMGRALDADIIPPAIDAAALERQALPPGPIVPASLVVHEPVDGSNVIERMRNARNNRRTRKAAQPDGVLRAKRERKPAATRAARLEPEF